MMDPLTWWRWRDTQGWKPPYPEVQADPKRFVRWHTALRVRPTSSKPARRALWRAAG